MRSVFLADAHLKDPSDPNYRALLGFLDTLCGSTETLYVMGDLFEFWLGYPVAAFPHYRPVLDRLQKLAAGGTRIVYFEGNHDFHLGPFFTRDLRGVVHAGPAEEEMAGVRTFLCHGDQIDTSDYATRALRALLHSSAVRHALPLFPLPAASAIARRMMRRSRRRRARTPNCRDCRELIRKFAAERFREGYGAVVTGHFHLPFLDEGEGRTLLSVGGWGEDLSYAELDRGRFTLRTYTPSSSS